MMAYLFMMISILSSNMPAKGSHPWQKAIYGREDQKGRKQGLLDLLWLSPSCQAQIQVFTRRGWACLMP